MRIFLARHGKAESQSDSGLDRDRALSEQGVRDVTEIAEKIKNRPESIQKIFFSPYRRARQTAALLQKILNCPQGMESLPQLASGVAFESLAIAVEERALELDSVLLVGHMPDLGAYAAYLTSAGQELAFHAGEIKKIETPRLNGATGKLVYSLTPEGA